MEPNTVGFQDVRRINQPNGSAEPCWETQVQARISRARHRMENLEALVGNIINRLGSVSQSSAPTPVATANPPREVLCKMADEISSISDRASLLIDALEDQLRRLEV